MHKICKDGRIYGQNNKEAGDHLGILTGRKKRKSRYIKKIKKERNPNSIGKHFQTGDRNPFYGRHHSEETKMKMRGRKVSEEAKRKMSLAKQIPKVKINCKICGKEKYVDSLQIKKGKGIFCSHKCSTIHKNIYSKRQNTDIERLMENELIERGISYTKQVPLLGITIVDFLLLHDIIIYCDGDYWHSLLKAKIKDAKQDFMLTFYGYKVFRFTGLEIKKNARKCVDIILKYQRGLL